MLYTSSSPLQVTPHLVSNFLVFSLCHLFIVQHLIENCPLVLVKNFYKESNFVCLLLTVDVMIWFGLFACAEIQLFLQAGILGFA